MKRSFSVLVLRARVSLACCALLILTISSHGDNPKISPAPQSSGPSLIVPATETGIASYYGAKYHGKPTASGEIFNMNDFSAAHPKLAFGTRVKVTHLESNRAVIVRINDRGPFVLGRVIDLSQAAAAELQIIKSGLARVKVEILE